MIKIATFVALIGSLFVYAFTITQSWVWFVSPVLDFYAIAAPQTIPFWVVMSILFARASLRSVPPPKEEDVEPSHELQVKQLTHAVLAAPIVLLLIWIASLFFTGTPTL